MKSKYPLSLGLLLGLGLLGGCANQQATEQSLEQARQMFQKVKEDQNVLSSAPKDVIRAGESLARAERLSSYLGNDADVVHYAYLSQRYSEIATQHGEQSQNQARVAKLQLERERLQRALLIIRDNCETRTEYFVPTAPGEVGEPYPLDPIQVQVGGATIFVLDCERFERL